MQLSPAADALLAPAVAADTAIFVASKHHFAGLEGGQQLCTHEFALALEKAGFLLVKYPYTPENGLVAKIGRRLSNRPYHWQLPAALGREVVRKAHEQGARTVFLNGVDLAPLAAQIKELDRGVRIVLLSHGLESVDYVHTLRARTTDRIFDGLTRSQETTFARQLIEECRQRVFIDGVICLASFEAEIERWLGARRVIAIPRTIQEAPLDWAPVKGRIGFVGRLDHPPNLEGLRLVLDELAKSPSAGLELRLVGKPGDLGARLAANFDFVSYLGSMSDRALRDEASTWSVFSHPLFCYARGASTKLAVGIGWRLPIVTTDAGCRGYEWTHGNLIRVETPTAFISELRRIALDEEARTLAASDVRAVAESCASLDDVAGRLRAFLAVNMTN